MSESASSQLRTRRLQRRSFLKGLAATSALLLPGTIALVNKAKARSDDGGGQLTRGDASILRFLCAAEILEADLWEQYWELSSAAGIAHRGDFASQINPSTGQAPVGTGGNLPYTTALQLLDSDMPQYIVDNTDDEFSHTNFLLAYLKSKGANTSDLDLLVGPHFRTVPGSVATGSANKGRLTNLTKLTIDTSYWGRYRSDSTNPDLGDTSFVEAVPSLNVGQHTAIPRTDADASNPNLIKAIAFTAGFHFGFIEQGGTSLYPALAQRVSDPEVLRVVLSIGPSEALHFQVWHDKAGNANAGNPPLTVVDPINNSTVTFVDLTVPTGNDAVDELIAANLIMPEPCPFLNRSFPVCSIVRPTETEGAAMGAVKAFTADGLFIGQTAEFMQLLNDLATDADQAKRRKTDFI
ncbi:MAG: ferritin-like domain-containing protein [Verrucomicrobia bacterium]|nr:ferritin-like domain-containing protein [Verrucomicrobiota bacterium]